MERLDDPLNDIHSLMGLNGRWIIPVPRRSRLIPLYLYTLYHQDRVNMGGFKHDNTSHKPFATHKKLT